MAISQYMSSRGPDGSDHWSDLNGRLSLVHRRLSIIDLSNRASQPMQTPDGKFTITFNGEIYNYKQLRRELEQSGAKFRTQSDTEVILQLYAREGEAMFSRLRGMYAFGIWNAVDRTLVLARDPYGIKPLYYANDGWSVRFASQVKALRAGGGVSDELDPAGVVGFHLLGSVPEPFTWYRAIRCVPASTYIRVTPDGVQDPVAFASIAGELARLDGPLQEFRADSPNRLLSEAVRDSVRHHMIADVEVGAFLSSGIDSAAVVGHIAEAGIDVRTITLAFSEYQKTEDDEAPLAEKYARSLGLRHTTRRVTKAEFEEDLPRILHAMDQPSIDGINTWFVSKAARELGIKVAVSGIGGDELLAGYSSFERVPSIRRWAGIPARVPLLGPSFRLAARGLARVIGASPKLGSLLELGGSYPGAYLLARGVFMPSELNGILDPDLVKVGLHRLKPLGLIAATMDPDPGTPTGRMVALESCNYLRNQLLRDADWAGMAHSVEIRTPLVDFSLLRAVAPLLRRIRGRSAKLALARSPRNHVPSYIHSRPKSGFGVPLGAWANSSRVGAAGERNARGNASRRWARELMYRYVES